MIFHFELQLLQNIYSEAISIQNGATCIFTPTCSQFTFQSIKLYGPFWGILMSLDRIQRCNPLSARAYYYPIDPLRKRYIDPPYQEYILAEPEIEFSYASIENATSAGDFAYSLGLYREAANLYVADYLKTENPQNLVKAAVSEIKAGNYKKAYALLLILQKEHGIDTLKLRVYTVLKGSEGKRITIPEEDPQLQEYQELFAIFQEYPPTTEKKAWLKVEKRFKISEAVKSKNLNFPPHFKSPALGLILSTFPGGGKFYAGRSADALASLIGISLLGATSFFLHETENPLFVIPASLAAFLYAGNFYGGYMAVVHYNRKIVRELRSAYAESLINKEL